MTSADDLGLKTQTLPPARCALPPLCGIGPIPNCFRSAPYCDCSVFNWSGAITTIATLLVASSCSVLSCVYSCSLVMELSVKRMSLSSCNTLTPCGLLNVAFAPSADSMSPPAVYIQLVKCQPPWLPELVSANPATDGVVSALA